MLRALRFVGVDTVPYRRIDTTFVRFIRHPDEGSDG
jgi:hypothetical protein